jgi:hypothetical protein
MPSIIPRNDAEGEIRPNDGEKIGTCLQNRCASLYQQPTGLYNQGAWLSLTRHQRMQLHDLGFGKPFQAGCFVVEVFKTDAKFGKPTLRN